MIHTPLAGETFETNGFDCFVERLVPDSTGLFHSIDALHEFHHPVIFSGDFKAFRLFHVHRFVFQKDAVEESRLDVEVLDVPVERGREV